MYSTNLTKIVTRRKKRVGRGYGSGVGHASTRGQKGQNARAGGQAKRGFTGDKNSLIRRMPVERGYGGSSAGEHAVVVRISRLLHKEIYEIDLKSLVSIAGNDKVKLVGESIYDNLDLKKVVVKADVPVSKSLREKITAAGGKVEEAKQEIEESKTEVE